jgi:hypothetical protein
MHGEREYFNMLLGPCFDANAGGSEPKLTLFGTGGFKKSKSAMEMP